MYWSFWSPQEVNGCLIFYFTSNEKHSRLKTKTRKLAVSVPITEYRVCIQITETYSSSVKVRTRILVHHLAGTHCNNNMWTMISAVYMNFWVFQLTNCCFFCSRNVNYNFHVCFFSNISYGNTHSEITSCTLTSNLSTIRRPVIHLPVPWLVNTLFNSICVITLKTLQVSQHSGSAWTWFVNTIDWSVVSACTD